MTTINFIRNLVNIGQRIVFEIPTQIVIIIALIQFPNIKLSNTRDDPIITNVCETPIITCIISVLKALTIFIYTSILIVFLFVVLR